MTILHGAWILASREAPAGLALWGEQPPSVRKTRPVLRRKPAAVGPPLHPFALTGDGLRHALSQLGLTEWSTQTNVRQAVAVLPTCGEAPLRSSELAPEEQTALVGAPWSVPVVLLDEIASLIVLPRIAAASAEHPALVGDDLRAWVVAARFTLSLLVRQRLAPGMQTRGEVPVARWTPVVDEPGDRANLRAVEASMPPAAVALGWAVGGPRGTPREALADFVAAAVDRVVRRAHVVLPTVRSASAADHWLSALVRQEAEIPLLDGLALAFRRQVDAWSDVTSYGGNGEAFRLCFRLIPPPAASEEQQPPPVGRNYGQKAWKLEYLLQATDDPSLLVPVDEVWNHQGATARFLTRRFDQPQEQVLASLGRAARVFSPIEESLRSARPEGASLSAREAADLVRDKALLLKASGFGVLLPGLDSQVSVRLRLGGRGRQPSPSGEGTGLLNLEGVVTYDWELALGGQTLSREEFEMLARLKEPLVQIRGRWVDAQPDQIERALAFIRKHGQGGVMSLPNAVATMVAPESLDGLVISGVQATGWVETLIADLGRRAAPKAVEAPPGLHGTLRPYQERGVAWLATLRRYSLGALLADDMGLGKTLQVICLLLREKAAGIAAPTLVICPTSVVGNWRHEVEHFAPSLQTYVHHGADRATGAAFRDAARQHDVVISTYALLHRDQESLAQVPWNGLVLDEAQNVKNSATRASQAARAIQSAWRVGLTGTPVENRLADLWSIFEVINPGYLGSAEQFRKEFALPIERAADADATARLKALTNPFVLRRVKTDRSVIADLPEKNEMKVYCSLTREQVTLYEAVVQNTLAQIGAAEGIQRRGLVLGLLTRLKQLCDHPTLLLHDGSELLGRSGKLARLGEMLEEVLAIDERALVFTQYAEMGTHLKRYLAQTTQGEVLFLHGGTPAAERDRMVTRFQSETNGPHVFVLSLKAGGTGLNLTRANHVFHFDRWWNPAVENQATDRAFRIGQTRNVQVHKLLCSGTFEERLDELIERKTQLAQSIVGTSEAWITELGVNELRNLFQLRRDAAVVN